MEKKWIFFILLLFLILSCQVDKKNKFGLSLSNQSIALLPLNNIPMVHVQAVKKEIEHYYGMRVIILDSAHIPSSCFNTGVSKKTGLNFPLRYRADSILEFLGKRVPENCDYIMGITDRAISVSSKDEHGNIEEPIEVNADWIVFGLSYLGGQVSVISLSEIIDRGNIETSHKRLAKVARHELGHNLGLDHCPRYCFMHEANKHAPIYYLDKEPDSLCRNCVEFIENKEE